MNILSQIWLATALMASLNMKFLAEPFQSIADYLKALMVDSNLQLPDAPEKELLRNLMQVSLHSRNAFVNVHYKVANTILPIAPVIILGNQNDTLGGSRVNRELQVQL